MSEPVINIALSGDVGTGTTTLGRNLASTLGWQHVNAGDYFRAWHREQGIPLEETQEVPESVDRELDERFQKDLTERGQTVFESHLAGWLARENQQTYRILCVTNQDVAMARIASRESWSLDYATEYSILRSHRLSKKFEHLYGVTDPYDPTFFSTTIDTTHMSAGQVLDMALSRFLSWLPDGHKLAEVLQLPD